MSRTGGAAEASGHVGTRRLGCRLRAQPFIVAPCLAKDGEEKVSAWNKFQRFCFVIETPEYLQTTLPEPKKTVEGAAARGQLPKSG